MIRAGKIAAALAFGLWAVYPVAAEARLHNCTVSAVGVNFGSYDVLSSSSLSSTGSVTVSNCTAEGGGGTAVVSLSTGLNSGNYVTRAMKKIGGSDTLNYNFYLDAAVTTVWGNGTGGTQTWQPSDNGTQTVFGSVPGRQIGASAGTYTDSVTVTINF